MQYIGSRARSGERPYCASSSAARSSASGCLRNCSHTAGDPGGSGPDEGGAVAISLAGDRTLATQVERAKRVDLPAVRRADRHAVLLLHGRIRRRRLHPAELKGRPRVLIEVGHERRDGHRLGGELQRRPRAHGAGSCRDRRAVPRDEAVADAVVSLRAIDVGLNEPAAGELTGLDGAMHVGDRRVLELKAAALCPDTLRLGRKAGEGEGQKHRRNDVGAGLSDGHGMRLPLHPLQLTSCTV